MKIIKLTSGKINEAASILAEAYGVKAASLKKDFTSKERNMKWLIAVIDGKVAGVLGYLFDYSHYANFLEDIGVGKDYRRKGVAKALIEKFISISRKEQPKKQRFCLSSTTVSNKASIKMHKSLGFIKLGVIKKLHYGEDEIIFGYGL